jgi:hypothetical protein
MMCHGLLSWFGLLGMRDVIERLAQSSRVVSPCWQSRRSRARERKPATLRLQPWLSFAQDVWVVLLTNFAAPVRIGRSRRISPRAHLPESPLIK